MLDDLFTEISDSGWMLNNCYQREDGSYRVNLRRPDPDNLGDYFTDWAEAPTLAEALAECMAKLHEAEFTPNRPVTFAHDKSPQPTPDAQGSLLLSSLGIVRKPKPTLRRL